MTQEEVNLTHRIVIDVRTDRFVTMYIERIADASLLDVVLGLNGIEIKHSPHNCDRTDEHEVPRECRVTLREANYAVETSSDSATGEER